MRNLFPLEISVLSSYALRDYISKEYFPNYLPECRLYYRGLHDIYRVIADQKEYFFKVYRQGLRSMDEIQAEVDLLNHLKSSDIDIASPIIKHDGTFISQFNTVNGIRYGVLFKSVGEHELSQIEETSEVNERLGSYIANIHDAFDKTELGKNRWKLDAQSFIDNSMDVIREFSSIHDFDLYFLEDVAKNIKQRLEILSIERPQYGVCHGDIYSGNIRVDANNNPILFDFDFCGIGWRTYDISIFAFPFGMGSDETKFRKREERKDQFLNGYNKVRAMSEEEVNSISLFIPFRRIFNIGTLYISYLPNTWGYSTVIRNVDEDINLLKKWLELNPIF